MPLFAVSCLFAAYAIFQMRAVRDALRHYHLITTRPPTAIFTDFITFIDSMPQMRGAQLRARPQMLRSSLRSMRAAVFMCCRQRREVLMQRAAKSARPRVLPLPAAYAHSATI